MESKGNNRDQKIVRVPRMPDRQYAYFRDDQITCLMSHDMDQLTEDHLKSWRDEVERFLAEQFPNQPRIIWPPRWSSFPRPPDQEYAEAAEQPGERQLRAFSVLTCDMENAPADPLEFVGFISALSNRNKSETALAGRTFAGLTIEAVSPNWLASSASQSGGTGGPGSWPFPYRGNPSRAPYQFRDLIHKLKEWDIYAEGEDVDVLILDTAPCPHDLVAAYKECKSWHPLIRTLLGPNGKLKLYPATYEENLRMGSTSLNRHDYKMTDHGLFAAGIIHSIVPQATIHLIEVLSPLGVGDLQTLTGGFDKAYKLYQEQNAQGRKSVINCSWMLDLPVVEAHLQSLSYTDPEYVFEQAVLDLINSDPNHASALRAQCDLFSQLGRQVVAAAGNDWKGESERNTAPATRYPAAFLSAFGVGALPKDSMPDKNGKHEVSKYSNIADVPNRPEIKRVITLGGEEGEGCGVLGLYIGEFPGCETKPNCTKWAWWAGTSFATPILTGAVAAVLSSNKARNTQEAADKLFRQPSPENGRRIIKLKATKADEAVMEARQVY